MNSSLDYLLEELAKRMSPESPKPEKLITSGKHFSRWLTDRLHYNDQILINAIECQEHEMQDRLRYVQRDIENEFSGVANIKTLPYPYDSIEAMREVIDGLIAHFGASISVDDAVVSTETSSRRTEQISGYLILTVINFPVII